MARKQNDQSTKMRPSRSLQPRESDPDVCHFGDDTPHAQLGAIAEGDIVAIPLSKRRWAIALIVRATGRLQAKLSLLLYVYEVCNSLQPTVPTGFSPTPNSPIARIRTGSPAIADKRWPRIGRLASFSRKSWPMPLFLTTADDSFYQIVKYNEDCLAEALTVTDAHKRPKNADQMIVDEVFSPLAVETHLASVLKLE